MCKYVGQMLNLEELLFREETGAIIILWKSV